MANLVDTEVLVVGAGNAAMAAAVAAREQGVDVVVLEKAAQVSAGRQQRADRSHAVPVPGNGRPRTPTLGCQRRRERGHWPREFVTTQSRTIYDDIMEVTDGRSDPTLAGILVSEAYSTVGWMRSYGHAWIPSHESPTSANVVSFDGGGFAMQERWFRAAERLGIPVHYGTRALELLQDRAGRVTGVRARTEGRETRYNSRSVILACGSFESSPEMRAKHLGAGWDKVKLRGVPFNTGDGLNMALELDAQPYGSWVHLSCVPTGLESTGYDVPVPGVSGVYWSRYSYPFGIIVNVHGRRFVDEGETWRGLTYAKTGRAICPSPEGSLSGLRRRAETQGVDSGIRRCNGLQIKHLGSTGKRSRDS